MNAKEWKQHPRKKKKRRRRRICLLAAGDSFGLNLREELESRGRKRTNQMCLLSCGGCIVAMPLASTQELDSDISQTSLFLICECPSSFNPFIKAVADYQPLFLPSVFHCSSIFIPFSVSLDDVEINAKSTFVSLCKTFLHNLFLKEQTSPECEHRDQVFAVWNEYLRSYTEASVWL